MVLLLKHTVMHRLLRGINKKKNEGGVDSKMIGKRYLDVHFYHGNQDALSTDGWHLGGGRL